MSLVPSLLQAIVNTDGEALVMHAGDKPYVVAPSGQVELASRALTLDAVGGILEQLLPAEFQHALDEFGAVQYDLPKQEDFADDRFTVVAARGGDDVWVEVRRRRVPDDDAVPAEVFAGTDADVVPLAAVAASASAPVAAPAIGSSAIELDEEEELEFPNAAQLFGGDEELTAPEPPPQRRVEAVPIVPPPVVAPAPVTAPEPPPPPVEQPVIAKASPPPPAPKPALAAPPPPPLPKPAPAAPPPPAPRPVMAAPVAPPPPPRPQPAPAVVLPMARNPVRTELVRRPPHGPTTHGRDSNGSCGRPRLAAPPRSISRPMAGRRCAWTATSRCSRTSRC